MRTAVLVVLGWFAAHPALAQTVPGPALVQTFQRFCLRHFPEPARVEEAATTGLTPMAPDEVKRYLHDDPGHGWHYGAAQDSYVVTVEDTPFHTCAVRANFAATSDYTQPWFQTVNAWAKAGRHLPVTTRPPQLVQQTPLRIVGRTQVVDNGHGDVLLDIVTTYPDGHVEVRLARRALLPGQRP